MTLQEHNRFPLGRWSNPESELLQLLVLKKSTAPPMPAMPAMPAKNSSHENPVQGLSASPPVPDPAPGTQATIRKGPPLPPFIFMGKATT
jgi:hypothetical protein